jgi:hypothetical protein
MQMEDLAKETVIIVHGTWAAPMPDKTQWYQEPDGASANEGFVSKLDAALQERGSPARCWGHCTKGNPIFQWSGDNSWIARTRAAGALADYVAKLRGEGWRCHIVAHSHGGNVVVEALPQIIAAPSPKKLPGIIVTLGSPFMDTMSPVLKRVALARKIVDLTSWIAFTIIVAALAGLAYFSGGLLRYSAMLAALLLIALPIIQWFVHARRVGLIDSHAITQDQPAFFAMGSLMDEAWKILHHIGTMQNPLAVRSNLFGYLFASLRSGVSRAAQRDRIYGAKSYRDLGTVAKLATAIVHVFTTLLLIVFMILIYVALFAFPGPGLLHSTPQDVAYFAGFLSFSFSLVLLILVLFITKLLGETFYSAFLSPFRWCVRRVGSLGLIS